MDDKQLLTRLDEIHEECIGAVTKGSDGSMLYGLFKQSEYDRKVLEMFQSIRDAEREDCAKVVERELPRLLVGNYSVVVEAKVGVLARAVREG